MVGAAVLLPSAPSSLRLQLQTLHFLDLFVFRGQATRKEPWHPARPGIPLPAPGPLWAGFLGPASSVSCVPASKKAPLCPWGMCSLPSPHWHGAGPSWAGNEGCSLWNMQG